MTRVEGAVRNIQGKIEKKKILEVACGCAEFSIAAAEIAEQVWCIDIEDVRVPQNIDSFTNVHFRKMDATNMTFDNQQFDVVVLYNAIGHLCGIISEVMEECMRVTKAEGCIYVISSSKLDKAIIKEEALPYLQKQEFSLEIVEHKAFSQIRISRGREE